jgi:hypothetical protein
MWGSYYQRTPIGPVSGPSAVSESSPGGCCMPHLKLLHPWLIAGQEGLTEAGTHTHTHTAPNPCITQAPGCTQLDTVANLADTTGRRATQQVQVDTLTHTLS